MNDYLQPLLDQYWDWLKDKTTIRQINDWSEITTPHLDRHNDYIQIYARKSGNGFLLTDDGYTIDDLEMSGCAMDSPRRQDILLTTLRGFGVVLVEKRCLEVRAGLNNFAVRKHNLLQAMLAVNDLFYLAQSSVASLFNEDVAGWLDTNDIRYAPDVILKGQSGYDHRFNFIIPKSRTHPERLLRTINRPERNTAQAVVFACLDTQNSRPSDSVAYYALLNNSDHSVSGNVQEALRELQRVSGALDSAGRSAGGASRLIPSHLSEAEVEQAALAWLVALDWQVAHGPDIAPDTPAAERNDYGQVVLESRLRDALARLNPSLPAAALDDAFRKLTSPEGRRWRPGTALSTGCWSTE